MTCTARTLLCELLSPGCTVHTASSTPFLKDLSSLSLQGFAGPGAQQSTTLQGHVLLLTHTLLGQAVDRQAVRRGCGWGWSRL